MEIIDGWPRQFIFTRRPDAFRHLKSLGYKKQPIQMLRKAFANGYYAQIGPTSSRAGSTAFACGTGFLPYDLSRSFVNSGVSTNQSGGLFWFERGKPPFSVECFGPKEWLKYNDHRFDEFVEDANLIDRYLTVNGDEAGVLHMFEVQNTYDPAGLVASNFPFYLASIGRLEEASEEFKKLPGGIVRIKSVDQAVDWLTYLRSRYPFLDTYFETTFPEELDPRRER
jgi:hypothetical protein